MENNFKTFSISASAYRSMITDVSYIDNIKTRSFSNVTKSPTTTDKALFDNKSYPITTRRDIPEGTSSIGGKTTKIWSYNKDYTDTSRLYRRNYRHMGLWSRISRNSGGSLPKPLHIASNEEIDSADRSAIKNYLTISRGIRKCGLTVFAACAKMAIRYIGGIKDHKISTYNCGSIALSVKELSKDTHAGTDTMGRKNDPLVIKRVTKQVRDIFRKPISFAIFSKNISTTYYQGVTNIFNLPEIIFHRFQATYDSVEDICKEKSRIVWCVPYTIVSLENIFFGGLISNIKKRMLLSESPVYPIGLTNFQIGQRAVGSLRNEFRNIYYMGQKNYKIYSLDFSKYDASIVSWAKDLFFALTKPLINLDDNQSRVFDYLRLYVKYTPFIYDSQIFYKKQGISSGLLITNLFDTWWNLTIHYFVLILKILYPENIDDIYNKGLGFDKISFDTSKVKYDSIIDPPFVRVMGDDTIILCDEFTLILHRKVCELLGLKVTIKSVASKPDDDIFFLGRYWNEDNRPFQTESYIALRICYTRWYDDRKIPFELKDLHLNRILSICLPLLGGKEFLDKYLFDYEPYKAFRDTKEGFIYMKDFIEDSFRFTEYDKAFLVDSY